MSLLKLYKFSLAMPKKIQHTTLLNKESIAFAITGVKIQVRGNCCSNDSNDPNDRNDSNNSEKLALHGLNDALQKLINKQIQAQKQAAQDYLAIAYGFFDTVVAKFGTGGFFMKKYQEELDHMQDFLQYQILRYGTPTFSSINESTINTELTQIQAFKKALEIEKNLTELAEHIVKEANVEKDYECADFVDDYLDDQMKAICEIKKQISKLSQFCDSHGAYHFDLELAKAYPYKFKIKPDVYLY